MVHSFFLGAAYHGRTAMLKTLIGRGADMALENRYGESAWDAAR